MITSMIRAALSQRLIVVVLALVLCALFVWWLVNLPSPVSP